MINFKKNILLIGLPIVSLFPLATITSCGSENHKIENELLDLEFKDNVILKINPSFDLTSKNLLDVSSDNAQLDSIFVLPDNKVVDKNNKKYVVSYFWNFTRKNIVSLDGEGNILFKVDVGVKLVDSPKFVVRQREFEITIKDTMIYEEDQNLPSTDKTPNKEARQYVYDNIAFQPVRKDVFNKSLTLNLDFYAFKSLINQRPVIIEKKEKAKKESVIDAYSSSSYVKAPLVTLMNNTQYKFNIEYADFDELNPRLGIYKIRVTPELDEIFNYDFINYAREKYSISFDKIYFYYEKNFKFKYPTSKNMATHLQRNTAEVERISSEITQGNLIFKPIVKNYSLIIGKKAEEIVKINSETPGGIFLPPIFSPQYSIEPSKPISFSITSVTADDQQNLSFSLEVKVGHSGFVSKKSVSKKIHVSSLFE